MFALFELLEKMTMGRPNKSFTAELKESLTIDISGNKHAEILINLNAIYACFDHKVTIVAEINNIGYSTLYKWIKAYKKVIYAKENNIC
jgi:transposase-like protein